MIRDEQAPEMNKLIKKIKRKARFIYICSFGGEFDKALKYIEQGEQLIKRFQGDLPEEIKEIKWTWLYYRAHISGARGNLALSFKYAKELIRIGKLYDYKRGISLGTGVLGRNYWLSGDLDTALVHIDSAITLYEDNLNDLYGYEMLADQLDIATFVSIEKEDLERAKKYFKRIEEIRELKSGIALINDVYRISKAYLLKSSMRSRDRVMAEDIFKEIIEEDRSSLIHYRGRSFFINTSLIIKLRALSQLCELLLVELRVSNDINIIGEIKPLIEKLIGMAQHSGLYYFLIEENILHGKLALIMFDIESSRRYLTQARRMAEIHGFIGLAEEITGLHEAMMEKLDTWEQLEKNNAPLSERMELARLNDHLKGKFLTRMMKMERVTEDEVTVYKGSQTCLVCKGSVEGFNIYVCPTCKSNYCKACTQAVIDLENQCWSCNSPIDASKPMKPYKPKKEVGDTKESKKPKKY